MHRPCSTISSLPLTAVGAGIWPGSSTAPLKRKLMGVASGLPVAAKWSPSTPLSAATTAARWGDSGGCAPAVSSQGVRARKAVSADLPTRVVMPRTAL